MVIDKRTAYDIFRKEADEMVKVGTPHVKETGLENDEFFFATIAALESFQGDKRFLNPPGTPVALVRKSDGEVVKMHIQTHLEEWVDMRATMTPVNYLAA